MLIEAAKETTNPWVVPAFVQWLNGLTLPGLLGGAWIVARWYTKKEDEAKTIVASALEKLETLRSNDLHHIQLSLTTMQEVAEKHHDAEERHQEAMIEALRDSQIAICTAIQSSQTAIVQAIIASK
jgi:hypothetical protein